MIVLLSLAAFTIQGCTGKDIIEEHNKTCKQNIKVIVHNDKLWRDYRSQAEDAHQKEMRSIPPVKWRPLYVSVGDFKVAYGDKKTYSRANIEPNSIARDDLYIMKGDEVVIQLVDYIAYYKSIDGPTGLNCLHYYKKLIIGDMDR